MKHLLSIFALILTLSNITAQQTVAVLDFEGIGLSKDEARALSDRFSTEFLSLSGGRFFLLERQQIGEILNEQGLQQAVCTTSECAVQAGIALGAKLIITGSIAKMGTIVSVNARMLDVETSQIINSISHDQEGDIGTLLIKGMKIVAKELLEDNRQISPLIYSESKKEKKIANSLFGAWYAQKPLIIGGNKKLQHITLCKPNGYWDTDLYEGNWYKVDVGCFMSGELVPRYRYASLTPEDIFTKFMHSFISFFEYKFDNNLLAIKIIESFDDFSEGEIIQLEIISLKNDELKVKFGSNSQVFKKFMKTDFSTIDKQSWKKPISGEELWKVKNEDFLGRNLKDASVSRLSSGVQWKVIKKSKYEPKFEDKNNFTINTEMRLIDGTRLKKWGDEFISSYDHPLMKIEFGLSDIVNLMPRDAHWRVYLPAEYNTNFYENYRNHSVLIVDIKFFN